MRKLFEQHSKEIAVVFLNVKLLPEIIHTNCFGCVYDYPSQREHDCLMMNKEESFNMYFEEILKKKDFSLINHLVIWRLSPKFPDEEIWEDILCFNNNEELYLKDKNWCRQIKHK